MAPISDHFDGRRFHNPTGPPLQPLTAVPRMLREQGTAWPRWIEEPQRQPSPRGDAVAAITFIGHSTFLIQTAGGNILTDPMYSDRAGPWNLAGPRRVRPPAVAFDDLPAIGVVLVSHNHYDHCDLATLRRLSRRFDPIAVTPLGNGALLRSAGLRKIEELDWWQSAQTTPLPIALTPAHHFSARGIHDRNRALWGGFMITAADRRIYFAGDTAYAPFFADVPRRLGAIDLALLPIGAYEPRWFMRSVHMNPEEAVQAHLDLGSPETIGMHFGTFQLTAEGIDEPLRALEVSRNAHQVTAARFRTLTFGETMHLV
jgi:L-ascorbate metabolism protein UlaG (beta-lactamase superfamily)